MIHLKNSPLSLICTASSNEIKSTRELLGGIKETLLSHKGLFQDSSKSSAEQFKKLRERLFQTERERMSAFSLVSHQMSGFIQMSAADVSGSRFGSGTSFWQYFGVINESRFVIFKDTSKVSVLVQFYHFLTHLLLLTYKQIFRPTRQSLYIFYRWLVLRFGQYQGQEPNARSIEHLQ